MASACLIISRGISTSCANYGKRNFRKFPLYGKRGSRLHKEREAGPNPVLPTYGKFFFSINNQFLDICYDWQFC